MVSGITLEYSLVNIHFHTESEHKVNGDHHSIEMHMVHSLMEGQDVPEGRTHLVIGVFFDNKGASK